MSAALWANLVRGDCPPFAVELGDEEGAKNNEPAEMAAGGP
jgi:hypothetical protein